MINKILISFVMLCFTTHCIGQVQTYFVMPNQTDANYAVQDSHLITRNQTARNNKLFLFFGGSFSSPKDYGLINRVAAGLGYDAISLSYPNDVGVNPLGTTADSLVFDKFRQEICFGTPLSNFVAVDSFNAIYTRTIKLIQYLAATYPTQNWQQYLATSNTLNWSKIAVSGHSQGAGHAAYLAKYYAVERCALFSGPNDYSVFYNKSGRWLRQAGVTPPNKQFAFLHLQDEIVPFSQQYANVKGLGLLQTIDSVKTDNASPPYGNARCLYSNLPAAISGQYHGSTAVAIYTPLNAGNAIFLPVWQYMLTTSTATNTQKLTEETAFFSLYPNPTTHFLTLVAADNALGEATLVNSVGQIILTKKIEGKTTELDVSFLPNGVYFVKFKGKAVKFVKK